MARAHERTAALPVGEELEALARHHHRVQVEHQSAQPESSLRRRLEDTLLDVRQRFYRLLDEWVQDEDLRSAWRDYLDHHGPRPGEPGAIDPRVFLGRAEVSGTVIEVRRAHDAHEIWADGVLADRVEASKDLAVAEPGLRYRWGDNDFEEIFAAADEAVAALREFLDDPGESPPWDYASELFADGLIDIHFALTPRGRRALAR